MTTPSLSVIISVYKKPQFLELVLEGLKNQTFKNFEILIADDGSGNDVKAVIDNYNNQFSHPIVHVWHNDDGFRKTIIVNKAVALSKSIYLVFIDGDCILHHRFIEMHYRYKKPEYVLSGRRVMFDKELSEKITNEDVRSKRIEKFSFWKKHTADERSLRHGFIIPMSFFFDNFLRKHYYILGSNLSMYKQAFISVNGYDEDIIGRGMEDSNLEQRMKINGHRIMRLTRKALQYHIYHTFDPVPHNKEALFKMRNPKSFWVKDGIDKYLK